MAVRDITPALPAEIADLIVEDPQRGPAYAQTREEAVPIWAVIGCWLQAERDQEVADTYGISPESVAAALSYYKRHRREIDAKLTSIEAAFRR